MLQKLHEKNGSTSEKEEWRRLEGKNPTKWHWEKGSWRWGLDKIEALQNGSGIFICFIKSWMHWFDHFLTKLSKYLWIKTGDKHYHFVEPCVIDRPFCRMETVYQNHFVETGVGSLQNAPPNSYLFFIIFIDTCVYIYIIMFILRQPLRPKHVQRVKKKNFSGSRKFFWFPSEWKNRKQRVQPDPVKKKLSGARKVFFIVISVSALWWHPSSQPRRAPKARAGPEGTQAAGPAGHPRHKRPRRAPKQQRGTAAPTVPRDSGPGGTQGTSGRGSKQPAAPESFQD